MRAFTTIRTALGLAALLSLGPGCSQEIGDECSSDAECGQGRFCDLSSRAGYCTISPCKPNTCPDNSICVEFENEQTFCMLVCESDDCRTGYFCDEETAAAPFCRQRR